MKILFSPSEGKAYKQPLQSFDDENLGANDSVCSFHLSPKIQKLHHQYLDFVNHAEWTELQKAWGFKRIEDVRDVREKSLHPCLLRAIECYQGVAYEALNFAALGQSEQDFILDSVLIFSNLFGAVRASEYLPYYKLKQGEGFGDFKSKKLYASLQDELDKELEGEFIVDLRAEFYQKLYQIKSHHFTFEFLKNGKRVSHYAKYYRGIVLREIAKNRGIKRIQEELEGLKFLGSRDEQNRTIYVFSL